jgi:hypothetical protein
MKNLFLTSLVFSTLLLGTSAFAGNEKGNGGDGLWLDGKLYSLDLVEAGVEVNPYFDNTIPMNEVILDRLTKKLDSKVYPVKLLAAKLSEISSVHTKLAIIILKSIEMYQWRLVNSSLMDVQDENSILAYPSADLVQLATRKLTTISIDRSLWAKLDDANKVALVIHEMMYALDVPVHELNPYKTGEYLNYWSQSSPSARQLTGYFFTQDLITQGAQGLKNLDNKFLSENGLTYGGSYPIIDKSGSMDIISRPFYDLSFGSTMKRHYVSTSAQEESSYISSACNASLRLRRIDLSLGYSSNFIKFESYKAKDEQKKYVRIGEYLTSGEVDKEGSIIFDDLNDCISKTTENINDYFESIRKDDR